MRYTIRRGEPRGSVVANPRADLALLAPLDGAALATLHASSAERLAEGRAALEGAYDIADEPAATEPLVLGKVG